MKLIELFTGPEQWTKDVPARKADGECVSSLSPEACQWCLFGRLNYAFSPVSLVNEVRGWETYECAMRYIRLAITRVCQLPDSRSDIVTFNDDPTTEFPLVQQVLAEADALMEKEGIELCPKK